MSFRIMQFGHFIVIIVTTPFRHIAVNGFDIFDPSDCLLKTGVFGSLS